MFGPGELAGVSFPPGSGPRHGVKSNVKLSRSPGLPLSRNETEVPVLSIASTSPAATLRSTDRNHASDAERIADKFTHHNFQEVVESEEFLLLPPPQLIEVWISSFPPSYLHPHFLSLLLRTHCTYTLNPCTLTSAPTRPHHTQPSAPAIVQ